MALIEKETVRFFGGGVVGAGLVVAWPYIGAVALAVARPLLKSILRQSVIGLARSREQLARASEAVEDLVAEVRSEIEEEHEEEIARSSEPSARDVVPSGAGSVMAKGSREDN